MSDRHNMGKPCPKCGDHMAKIEPKGDQQVARCATCNQYLKNVPKGELGVPTRSTATDGITPSQRRRIIQRDGSRCRHCGATSAQVQLHVDHVISKDAWTKSGVDYAFVHSDVNLTTLCDQCNLGKGNDSDYTTLHAAILAIVVADDAVKRRGAA
jgi:5-methylcytosine-specific restriction endonuclease McrA